MIGSHVATPAGFEIEGPFVPIRSKEWIPSSLWIFLSDDSN
jgi:hypothetical protein